MAIEPASAPEYYFRHKNIIRLYVSVVCTINVAPLTITHVYLTTIALYNTLHAFRIENSCTDVGTPERSKDFVARTGFPAENLFLDPGKNCNIDFTILASSWEGIGVYIPVLSAASLAAASAVRKCTVYDTGHACYLI